MSQVTVEAFHNTPVVTIPASDDESNAFHFGAFAQCGFIVPDGFEGATVSFLVSMDGVNFVGFYDNTDTLVSIPVTENRAYAFPINLFPFTWIKIKSASTESADRAIQLPAKY